MSNIYLALDLSEKFFKEVKQIVEECGGLCSLFLLDELMGEKPMPSYELEPEFIREEDLPKYKDKIILPLDMHMHPEVNECLVDGVQKEGPESLIVFSAFVRRQYRITPTIVLKIQSGELRSGVLAEY